MCFDNNLSEITNEVMMIRKLISITVLTLSCLGCAKRDLDVPELRLHNSLRDLSALEQHELILDYPLTLTNILNIAMTHNLEVLTQQYERAAQDETAAAERMKMLPRLTLDGFFDARSNSAATFVQTGNVIGPPQVSSTRETKQWDLRLTFNILDMGLAYFRSKQEKNKTLIVEQQHIRIRQKLVLDIVEAYWKAIAAQKTVQEAEKMVQMGKQLQADLQRQVVLRNLSKVQGLENESRLLDLQRQLQGIRYQFELAKARLAEQMGLTPGTCFELADVEPNFEEIPFCDITALEEEALLSRPELAVKDVEERIAADGIRLALYQLVPDVAIYGDLNGDENPFLVHNFWMSFGVRAALNLLNLPEKHHLIRAAKFQKEIAFKSRLALSIAVITQVHLAYISYREVLTAYQLAKRTQEVKEELSFVAQKERESGELHDVDALNFEMEALQSKIFALASYTDLQVAIEQINYAIGRPLLFCNNIDIATFLVGQEE